MDLSLERLGQIRDAAPGRYWVPGQFDNPDNVEAHILTTGPELWEQSGGRIGAFVDSQGSGGLLTGVGRYLRTRDPQVKLYAVEPAECALLSRRAWGQSFIVCAVSPRRAFRLPCRHRPAHHRARYRATAYWVKSRRGRWR